VIDHGERINGSHLKIYNKKIPAASRRGILDAFEKSSAKPNSIFAPRGGVLDPKLHNNINYLLRIFESNTPPLGAFLLKI
jgi:hypothetical protein